jgi:hypothetical protein
MEVETRTPKKERQKCRNSFEKAKKLSNSIQQNSQRTVTSKREKNLASKIKVGDLATARTQQTNDGTNKPSPSDDAHPLPTHHPKGALLPTSAGERFIW